MGLKLDKKYEMVVGYPSGEIVYLPKNIINKLKDYVYIDTIYDGRNILTSFMFNDSDYKNIINILSIIDSSEW